MGSCGDPRPPQWEKKRKEEKKGRRPHPAEEAAVRRLHSRAHQAQAAGRLVERLAHHRARVVHQHHVPDLRTRPGSGGRRARAQPRAASGVSGALIGVPGPHIARTRTSVSAQLGRCVGGSTCRANSLAAPPARALGPCQPERERLGLAPGQGGRRPARSALHGSCERGTHRRGPLTSRSGLTGRVPGEWLTTGKSSRLKQWSAQQRPVAARGAPEHWPQT